MTFRDINFIKQLKFSFIYKVLAILLSFILTRLLLQYLGIETYGIWSIILTLVNWILFFDLGIANGVKNKVSEELAKKNILSVKEFISTGYIILFFFSATIYMFFFIISFFINWQTIFNTEILTNIFLQKVVLTVLFFILLNFIFSIIIAVFNATQNASLIVLNQFISQLLALIMVYILSLFTDSNLLYIAISYGLSLLISNLILSFWFYKKHIHLMPSYKFFSRNKVASITSLGVKFFFLQLTILIILSTDKIIIAQLLGPSLVTSYDILFKYFSIITIIHGIINTPLWSMYTEAYEKNDFHWIESTLSKLIKLTLVYILLAILLSIFGYKIIELWIGDIDLGLKVSNFLYMGAMAIILTWYSIFAYFSNGINKTKVQLITASIGAIINLPLSIYFINFLDMGLNGVLLATIISLSIFGIAGPIQAFKEIKKMKFDMLAKNDK